MRHMILLLILLSAVLLPAAVSADTRVFDLGHRRAADLAPIVSDSLGEGARITALDRTLIVNAAPEEIDLAAELIARLDRPPRMLRVLVSQELTATGDKAGAGLSGRASSGSSTIVIGRPDASPRGGATIILGNDDRLRLDARTTTRSDRHTAEQFIVTVEGHPARISVGRRIPVTERWLTLARRYAQIVEGVRYETVDTGFEVLPELYGDSVQLAIRPFLAFHDPRAVQEIVFQELTTTVRIPLGTWYELGGTTSSRDEVSREILGVSSTAAGEGGQLRVRVEPQPN